MGRLLALCAGILVLAMLVPAAWPQETPTPAVPQAPAAPEDPLANAIAAVKARAAAKANELAEARSYLVDQRQVARPLIVQLLGDADAQVRMNAAIVLAQMAAAGDTSAPTLQALQTAAKDGEFAVAYWGFQGLMSDGVPAADQNMVIAEMMKMERPRALRLAALTTIGEKKPMSAAPIIVSHLQEILQEYMAQVETVVSSSEALPTPAPRGVPGPYRGPSGGAPGPMYPTNAPPPPSPSAPPTTSQPPGRRGAPANVTTRGRSGTFFLPGGGLSRGMRGPAGTPTGEQNNPLGPPTPGAVTPGQPRPEVVVAQVRRADLGNMTLDKLQALAHGVEALTIVAEVHQMGLVLEDIVANSSSEAPLFDFKTTPPWDLDKCVAKAVIYMNSNREKYGAAPEAPQPPAPPAPAAPPEAPPATGTAPATTAATPATTTPAP
jgi:hypothetical protein